ncbi:MAG: ATP synthase F1 subunit gamma [Ignavibacteria bacterium]|nr:ATP synthase F1 subunit gamma [Ignavibacteria bacterium]MBT8386214.1 ATP synthase F1 subunit gamma [Ignavibacteria bacterium]
MATLKDIKRRIVGVKNTQKITKAMKMVSAAKLRRAQTRIVNARPYVNRISEMLSNLATEEDMATNPFFIQRELKNVAVVVVTADRGLCGAFNNNIIKEAARYIDEELNAEGLNAFVYCVGKKNADYFSRRNYNVIRKDVGLFSSLEYSSALKISDNLVSEFGKETYDKVVIIYNEFISMIRQKIQVQQFLPIPVLSSSEEKPVQQPNYIFEPDSGSIFNYLIPKHLKAQIWRSLLESNAAELGARMTAMDNATTNAQEMIRSLNLTYNKERQAAITKEILEIVSGANALKASS